MDDKGQIEFQFDRFRVLAKQTNMKNAASLFLTLVAFIFVAGCASEKTGAPSGKIWYQQGKSQLDTMRDLAACQNEAAAYGQGSFMQGEQKVSWAIIDSMAESSRENKIVATCMIAKGYSLVDKNSPLLTNSQPTLLVNDPPEVTEKLLGHWESSSLKAKEMEEGVERMEFDFFPNNRLLETTIKNGKPYPMLARYYARGEKLAMWDGLAPTPRQDEVAHFSLIDNQLIISASSFQIVLQKQQAAPQVVDMLAGHWISVLTTTNAVVAATIDFKFLPQHRYIYHFYNKLNGSEQTDEGVYCYDANFHVLTTWCDNDLKPEVFRCSIGDDGHMMIAFTKQFVCSFDKLPETNAR